MGFLVEERKRNDRSFCQERGTERVPFFKIGTKNGTRSIFRQGTRNGTRSKNLRNGQSSGPWSHKLQDFERFFLKMLRFFVRIKALKIRSVQCYCKFLYESSRNLYSIWLRTLKWFYNPLDNKNTGLYSSLECLYLFPEHFLNNFSTLLTFAIWCSFHCWIYSIHSSVWAICCHPLKRNWEE